MSEDINELLQIVEPLNPSAFTDYTVEITDEWETSKGCGFTGDVLRQGHAVFSFENNGDGGANKYLYHDQHSRDDFHLFTSLCEENFPKHFEAVDYALIYLEVRDQEN